jgi:hypothetical protein
MFEAFLRNVVERAGGTSVATPEAVGRPALMA